MPFIVLDQASAAAAPVTTLGQPLVNVGETLSSMEQDLVSMLVDRTDLGPPLLRKWINRSYIHIATAVAIDEMKGSIGISLVPGQAHYLLPYAVSSIISASLVLPTSENINGGYPLDKGDLSLYRAARSHDDDPTWYFRMNDILVVHPTPNKARTLALDVRVRPLPMTANEHSPILGVEWHEAIVLGARRRGFSELLEYDKATMAENEYLSAVRQRTNREEKEDENRVPSSSAPQRDPRIRGRDWRRDDL